MRAVSGAHSLSFIPIKLAIINNAFFSSQLPEEELQLVIVRHLVLLQVPHKVQVFCKFMGQTLTQHFQGRVELASSNLSQLLLMAVALDALPGQPALQEVDPDEAQRLQVVPSRLLPAHVGEDGGEARCAYHGPLGAAVHPPRDEASGQLLCMTEINEEDLSLMLVQAHHEVGGADVTVHKVVTMHVRDNGQHLVNQLQDRLQRKLEVALSKQVLQSGAQQLHQHHAVV